jgi:predicted small secreted protein
MKTSNIISAAMVASALLIAIPGCDKGPAEKAGKSIDNAVDNTGDQIEKAGDAIQDTVKGDNN